MWDITESLSLVYFMGRNTIRLIDVLFFSFLQLHPQHMEAARLGVKVELHLLVYTTAAAARVPSHTCDLCPQLGATVHLSPADHDHG